jgi:uncharacterized protein (TIGR00730 family)
VTKVGGTRAQTQTHRSRRSSAKSKASASAPSAQASAPLVSARNTHDDDEVEPSRPSGRPFAVSPPQPKQKRGAVDVRADSNELDSLFRAHLADFNTAFAEMIKQPPSIVFFGGARLKRGDPYWDLAERFGQACAARGIPPKTGRGPGAMEAVPEGFIEWRDAHTRVVQSVVAGVSRLARLDDERTIGFNIHLQHEQKPTPFVENGAEIENFAFRKFSLYENVRGVVVMPGGFGTLDELLEVLVLRRHGRTKDPVVLAGSSYWQPILDAWRASAKQRGLDDGILDDVLVSDDPESALAFIESTPNVSSFDEEPDVLYRRMTKEIRLAREVVKKNAPAVTVLGGNNLADNDPARDIVVEVARRVSEQGGPVRVGDDGPIAKSVARCAAHLQRVLWEPASESKHTKKAAVFGERVPHKEALLRNSSAYVVLPDVDRGKDELCTVLCQIQTKKLARRPIVLVDSHYWKPIIESWQKQMIGPNHAYIAPEDVDLVRYADSADDVMRALESGESDHQA